MGAGLPLHIGLVNFNNIGMLDLQKDENIVLVCRRHWLVFLFATVPIVFAMVIILALPPTVNSFAQEFFVNYGNLIYLGAALGFEIFWLVLFLVITDYYLDIWVVTDHRLVFIELHGIFHRTVSSVNLRNIQDVSVRVHGIIPTVVKYGEVQVQSAGTEGSFIFKQIPKPYAVKDLILHTREQFLGSRDEHAHEGAN